MKKSTKQYIMVALICIAVIGGAAVTACLIFHKQISQKFGTKLDSALEELELNQRRVYVATKDINISELITKDNVTYKTVYASQPSYLYLSEEDIGKAAILDIKEGTQILSSMVSDMTENNLREVCFQVITLNRNLIKNDTVDIRILYPNGENYILLSKKQILNLDEGSSETYLWLTEEEIILMSSAIVDAYLYKGTQLYTTKYIEPTLQEASIVNYTPNLATLDLIKKDPNILEVANQYLSEIVRKQLENRLALSMDLDVAGIEWRISNNGNNVNEEGFIYHKEQIKSEAEDYEYGQ